ncbi:MAG: flagellar basal-body rod protein FlgG [Polyangiaceae bacterium]
MFRSLQIAATGMAAQETQLDTIANNLANANTAGYKRQDANFEELMYQTVKAPVGAGSAPSGVQLGSGTHVVATPHSFAQGSIEQTGNQLDVAIEGNGFIPVQRPNGQMAYTRTGSLKTDATGKLVTTGGLPIEPPISIPSDATSVVIGADGIVSATRQGQQAPTQLGQIQLVTFTNQEGLSSLGHNLFEATASSGDPTSGVPGTEGRGTILQGAVESSNVQVVTEMIGLIRAQRAYDINSKVISAVDEMIRNATQQR